MFSSAWIVRAAVPLQKGGRFGRHPLCKPCRASRERRRYERDRDAILERAKRDPERKRGLRRRVLRDKYGLTEAEYQAMYVAQRGCCAICERVRVQLLVDHHHGTGEVRGLLCCNCNFGIAELDDDPARCLAAAAYLRRAE